MIYDLGIMQSIPFNPQTLSQLSLPESASHKGQNGRVMVIGGSKLFHAAAFWSAEVASKIVDLVHFTSPAMENNDLMRIRAKEKMWSGIVVPFEEVEQYIEEDDVILIGPGMPREEGLMEGELPTTAIVNSLLAKYPDKKWVVDGGALQECDPTLLNGNMIITPHQGEWERLLSKDTRYQKPDAYNNQLQQYSKEHQQVTILLKGEKDLVCQGEQVVEVSGGNAGLTKGGTGDVLAGLAVALYAKNEAFLSAQVASYVNKKAGDELYPRVGVYYSAGDLVAEVPKVLKQEITSS
jgi:hydroxyethylthiazole kinase-like uncharacterized protein yjeF